MVKKTNQEKIGNTHNLFKQLNHPWVRVEIIANHRLFQIKVEHIDNDNLNDWRIKDQYGSKLTALAGIVYHQQLS